MEKVGHKYRICFIDYMWYVAGKWSEREHNNLDGGMLLFLCWLFVILIPVATPLACCYFGMGVGLAVVISLCFLPSLFCKIRYTEGRRTVLREHFRSMKCLGRRLFLIILIALALMLVNFVLMLHIGFIHRA